MYDLWEYTVILFRCTCAINVIICQTKQNQSTEEDLLYVTCLLLRILFNHYVSEGSPGVICGRRPLYLWRCTCAINVFLCQIKQNQSSEKDLLHMTWLFFKYTFFLIIMIFYGEVESSFWFEDNSFCLCVAHLNSFCFHFVFI